MIDIQMQCHTGNIPNWWAEIMVMSFMRTWKVLSISSTFVVAHLPSNDMGVPFMDEVSLLSIMTHLHCICSVHYICLEVVSTLHKGYSGLCAWWCVASIGTFLSTGPSFSMQFMMYAHQETQCPLLWFTCLFKGMRLTDQCRIVPETGYKA